MSYWSNDLSDTDRDGLVFGRDLIGGDYRPGTNTDGELTYDELPPRRQEATPRRRISRRKLRARIAAGDDLDGIDLRRARLDSFDLSGRDLSGLDMQGAHLRRARLTGSDLRNANLAGADLCEADLSESFLDGATVFDTYLRFADLSGADLSGARNLDHAFVKSARCDAATRWPTGFDAARAGVARR